MIVEINMKYNVTQDFYNENIKELCDDIKSGKAQIDMMKDHLNKQPEGLKWVKMTTNIINQ